MREKLEMLLDELQHLKAEGVEAVYCQDSSLEALKEAVKQLNPTNPAQAVVQPVARNQPPATLTPPKRLNPFSPLPESDKDLRTPTSPIPTFLPTPAPAATAQTQKLVLPQTPTPASIVLPKGNKQFQWDWLRNKALNDPFIQANVPPEAKLVFGLGDLDAPIVFCGDAPGPEEENQGEPFVGPAGQLLTKIIQAMGFQRHNVYLTNIMTWCPKALTPFGNRQATQEDMLASLPYLNAQLEIIQPNVIVALGAMAVNGLLGLDKNRKMGDIRGQWFQFQSFPLMITFHPSYLIHNSTLRTKRLIWEDMLKIMDHLHLPISSKQRDFFKAS